MNLYYLLVVIVAIIIVLIMYHIINPTINIIIYYIKVFVLVLKLYAHKHNVRIDRLSLVDSKKCIQFTIDGTKHLIYPLFKSSNIIITINSCDKFTISRIIRNVKGGNVKFGAIPAQDPYSQNYELSNEKIIEVESSKENIVIVFIPNPREINMLCDGIIATSGRWSIYNTIYENL